MGRAGQDGRRPRVAGRCVSPGRRGPLSGDPQLRPLRQGTRVPGRLQDRLGDHGARAPGCGFRDDEQVRELGSRRSGEMGAGRLCVRPSRLARSGPLARLPLPQQRARDARRPPVRGMGRGAVLVERQGRHERHLLLREQPVARRGVAAAAPRGDLRVGRLVRQLPRRQPPRRHHLHLPQELARDAGEDGATRPGRARREEPRHRRSRLRSGDVFARRACEEARGHVGRAARARDGRAVLPRAHGGLVEGERAAALGGELGRAGPAHARKFRRIYGRGVEAEVAGGARRLALGALLHRLRGKAAEALFRSFPQGNRQRLGQAAARSAERAPPGRKIRAARGERMAAGAHQVDPLSSRPCRHEPDDRTGFLRRLGAKDLYPRV